MKIQRLFVYPVKSILPVEVSIAEITGEGFRFDRQYLLIKRPLAGSATIAQHLTIKTTYGLALFQPSIDADWTQLTIKHTTADPESSITIPLTPSAFTCLHSKSYSVNIFGTGAQGIDMGDEPATFFSKHLGIDVQLLFISGNGRREIPGLAYSPEHLTNLSIRPGQALQPQRIRFADAAPFLVTSVASEQEARARLPTTSRHEDVIVIFRSNIHIDVGPDTVPFDEDNWRQLSVLATEDGSTKAIIQCIFKTPRCLSLNVDLRTGIRAPRERQLYGLLAKDRRVNKAFPHKPVFGQYACASPNGAILRVGDEVRVTERI